MPQSKKEPKKISFDQALNEIYFFKGVIPVEALKVLTEHQAEVTPYLMEILKKAILQHDRTGDYYVAHIFSLLLLAQFKEKKAYPLIIELLNLPVDSVDHLIGDMLTDTIPSIILSTYDGNAEPLFNLLTKPGLDIVIRNVIGNCFSALISQKLVDKNILEERLLEVVASGKMNEDPGFYTMLVACTLDSQLEPLYDIAQSSFKAGLVNENYIDFNYFQNKIKKIKNSEEQCIPHQNFNPIEDVVKELSKWDLYCGQKAVAPDIEPNANCPCGSGNKFKLCCSHRLIM